MGMIIDEFGEVPFSVLDTKQGRWQKNKQKWKKLGIVGEVGRKVSTYRLNNKGDDISSTPYTSIFDPFLCELMYNWFNIPGGSVLDPFAGGPTRGVVSEKLGYPYTGFDIREEQIDSNIENSKLIGVNPKYICSDSNNIKDYIPEGSMDMVFTCPPYFDLEVYSDDPKDISNMNISDFKSSYKSIIRKCAESLKPNRFAVIVVGDVRGKDGMYINLIDYTKQCFLDTGMGVYNEIILLDQLTSAALRISGNMRSRKVVKVHQNILVFYKGSDHKDIKFDFNEKIISGLTETRLEDW